MCSRPRPAGRCAIESRRVPTTHRADQARELDLRRGVRGRGRASWPPPAAAPRRSASSPSAPASAPRCASWPPSSTPARSSRSAPAPASPGLWLLRGMRADGVLTTVDIEAEHQRLAKETFTEAGIPGNRARTIAGAGLDVLPRLTDGHYDLVFCDGDKREYAAYLKEALRLLRPGGIVAFDNALWHDRVADPAQRDEETVAIRDLGRDDPRARVARAGAAARRRRPAGREEGVGARGLTRRRSRLRRGRGREAVPALGDRDDVARLDRGSAALPMICEPGDSAAPSVKVRWNSSRASLGREDVAALEPLARHHPPGLEAQPGHAGEAGVRGLGDVGRELLLDALGRVGERPADGEAQHQAIPASGSSEPSQVSSRRGPEAAGAGGPLVAVGRATRPRRRSRCGPTARRRRSAGGTGRP